jgi:hypothetical protein
LRSACSSKIDLSDRARINDQGVGNGLGILENIDFARFHTASAEGDRLPSCDPLGETSVERRFDLSVTETMSLGVRDAGSGFRDSFEILVSPLDIGAREASVKTKKCGFGLPHDPECPSAGSLSRKHVHAELAEVSRRAGVVTVPAPSKVSST